MAVSSNGNDRPPEEVLLSTELLRLRRLLAAREKEIQDLRSEMDHYFQALSHELKGPLAALEGFTELLGERISSRLDDEGRHHLDRIEANIRQLENLLGSITQMARAEVCGEEMEWFPIGYALQEALASLREEIRESNADIRVARQLPRVFGHPAALTQLFRNLVSNALKYSKPDRVARIEIGYEGEEIFHKFFVKDNGVGLPPEARERVFNVFFRVDNKPGVEGTGLGLAFVKRIVQVHGGEVWVRAREGQGATFYFTLPRFAGNSASGSANGRRLADS